MTQANLATELWASSGFVVDPDTDSSHPSGTGGPGKIAKGWLSETEPEEWENWWINASQSKLLNRVVSGLHQIDSTVTYKANSLVWDVNGKVYHAKVSSVNKPTTDSPSWEEAISYSQAAWLAITTQMATDYTNHIPSNVIKHGETIAQAGGKTAAAIDTQVANLRAPMDTHIGAHYPHHETAAQCGTIPSTGGTMDGLIDYRLGFALSDYDEVSVCAQAELAGVGAPNGAAFGVGYTDFRQGGRIQELVSVAGYLRMEADYGRDFSLPIADVILPLVSDTLTRNCGFGVSFLRPNTLAYTDKAGNAQTAAINAAPFEALGLKMDANTQIGLTSYPWATLFQCTAAFRKNGVLTFWRGHFTGQNLQKIFGTSGNIRDVRVWFKYLTDRQISSIPA